MSRGLWLWEAPYVVFYEVWRPREVRPLTNLNQPCIPGGSAKRKQTLEDRELGGGEVQASNQPSRPKVPGGSAK